MGQEIRGLVDVVERNHFNRAVHVAVGEADKSDRNAGTADLQDVGIVGGGAGNGGGV